jgi:hypothetical protein
MISELIDSVVDDSVEYYISLLKSKLYALIIVKDLGLIKNCNYVILRNEVNYEIKKCLKSLERKNENE